MAIAKLSSVSFAGSGGIGLYAGLLAGAPVAFLLAGWSSPAFLTVDNMFVVVRAASITGIVAVGMSYVTISGNLFALSAGQLAALLSVIYALLVRGDLGAPLSCVCVCAVAVLAGFLQGYAITIVKNPIIATIAFGAVFVGLAAYVSGNGNIRGIM